MQLVRQREGMCTLRWTLSSSFFAGNRHVKLVLCRRLKSRGVVDMLLGLNMEKKRPLVYRLKVVRPSRVLRCHCFEPGVGPDDVGP